MVPASFLRGRRSELPGKGCPNYRTTLGREVERFFRVELSGKSIRQINNGITKSPLIGPEETPWVPSAITTSGDVLHGRSGVDFALHRKWGPSRAHSLRTA